MEYFTKLRTANLMPGGACAQMAQASLAAGKEQAAIDCCEIFIDLIEAPAPVMGPVLPDLVRWAMAATSDASLELTTREMALQARALAPSCVMMTPLKVAQLMCMSKRVNQMASGRITCKYQSGSQHGDRVLIHCDMRHIMFAYRLTRAGWPMPCVHFSTFGTGGIFLRGIYDQSRW